MLDSEDTYLFLQAQDSEVYDLIFCRYGHFLEHEWPGASESDLEGLTISDYAQAGVLAALLGDYELLVQCVLALKGEPVLLTYQGDVMHCSVGGGQPIEIPANLNSEEGMVKLADNDLVSDHLKMVRLLSGGDSLVAGSPWGHFLRGAASQYVFDGNNHGVATAQLPIPEFRARAVADSGLLEGLIRKGQQDGNDPAWFDDLLCWGSAEMLSAHPENLQPYDVVFRLFDKEKDGGADICLTLTGPAGEEERDSLPRVMGVHYGMLPVGRPGNAIDQCLERNFLGSTLAHCADAGPDRVLCRTTASFLQSFPRTPVVNQAAYDEALENYLPVQLLGLRHMVATGTQLATNPEVDAGDHLCAEATVSLARVPMSKFFEQAMVWKGAASALRRLIPAQYLEGMLNYQVIQSLHTRKGLDLMCHLRDAYDFDATGSRINIPLEIGEFEVLAKKKLSLAGDWSVNFTQGTDLSDKEVKQTLTRARAFFQGKIEVGGVDFEASPAEILQAWHAAVSSNSFDALKNLKLLAKSRTFEEFRPALQSREDWGVAYEVFGSEVMEPYVDRLPDRLATRMAVQGFEI
ncbi:hypothetical protein HNP46_006340 [Pseudomonas nitritireducens]|uniref:Uncharacterized protein n=1 Tax=Pseudomonas nitroreducens TaxID=46680 RepID=A0A7W7P5L6_PSENT|nr:hypothetical protein [Pseudomonas nitritireducens]MBB4867427.1 hypothetical protein [Pseudomonas nitritireducens]